MTANESDQGRRNSLAAALVCLVTVVAFETMSVATIMPKVKADIGGLALYGWAFSGLALGEVMGIVVAGSWTDRANPARPMMIGLAVYAAGLVVSGTANSMLIVVVGRVLQGYGSGTVPAVAYVCVGRGFAEDQRARVFAWMSTAWVVPSMIGPSVAGVVAESIGWRAVFLGLIPVVIGVGALAIKPIMSLGLPPAATAPGGTAAAPGRSPGRTAFLASVAVVGTGVALGALEVRQLALLVVLVAGGLAALVWSFLQLAPAGTLRVARGLPAAVAVRGMVTFGFLGADAFVALALHDVRGMSIRQAGIVLSSSALTWTAGSWFSARKIASVGPRRLVVTGMAFISLGIAAMTAVISTSISPWFAVGAWLIAGLGIGMSYAPLSQAVISSADPAQLGAATSALQLSDVLGFALGTGLGGALIALADRHDVEIGGSTVHAGVVMAFAVTGAVAIAGVFAARRLHPMLSDARPTEPSSLASSGQA